MSKLRQHRQSLLARIGVFNAVLQALIIAVGIGYWYVQVAEGAHYRQLADNNRLRKLAIQAPRGLIYDRFGRSLAENVPGYALLLDRSLAIDLEQSLIVAAEILDQSVDTLEERLESERGAPRFQLIEIATNLTLSQVARFEVQQLEYPEFEIEARHLRLYRHAHQTAHLLGYLGEISASELDAAGRESTYRSGDLIGKRAIEKMFEYHLRGTRGEQVVVVDNRGRAIAEEEFGHTAAQPGMDLFLTIDLALQQRAASLLEGKVGAIVALDPRQGDVLAMVSAPSFDPNRFARGMPADEWQELLDHPFRPLQNRSIQNTYPPASVFKIVMAMTALEQKVRAPEETTTCQGFSKIYNHVFGCWNGIGHGAVDLSDSLRYSCNVYYHSLGKELGIDIIAAAARRFGLGRKTGLDLPGERAGLVPDTQWSLSSRGTRWYPGETISVSIGQGPILVTPMQVAIMTATIANGGTLLRPRLDRDSDPQPIENLNFDPAALELVRSGMNAVVNQPHGTGIQARVDDLTIAGKTGTAQVISQGTPTDTEDLAREFRNHAWFTSYAPAENPEIVIVVFVEHGGAGSAAAAPLAQAMYKEYLRGVERSQSSL